ncbi:T9SS type B sorting domain-containing protein [Dyadobacter frigoris]|uniref:T9SS type B sorting domain-containing protein n=1 Tax=Dyadobacter frigoris TaxID=2576211 RepID=A0A4V6BHU0_9BACT|nr:gliding motility-associated C-terminal domain-containing protein [Dyadobacter frigoris]TKT85713.1 T9SS type B sorting domain-containing protein [Dyadobacter frigoris]
MQAKTKNRYRKYLFPWPCLLLMMALTPYCFSNVRIPKETQRGYKNISNTYLNSIILQSPDVYCRGNNPVLIVTGQNVTWYADAAKTRMLAQGNSFHAPSLDQTTTFYLTETIDQIQTEVKAITIEIVDPFLLDMKITTASCGRNDGTVTVVGKGGTAHYPLQFKLNDGPLQTSPVFTNLSAGTYKFTIWAAGCFGSSDITVGQQPSPIIAAVDSISPHCGDTNGSLRIAAYGGTGSLIYSLNGIDFKSDNRFDNLAGGIYTISVRDESLCMVSQSVSLKKSVKLQLNTVEVMPTSCGKANGQVIINAAQGNGRLTYSLTARSDQLSAMFDNLDAGSYQVSALDQDGCSDIQAVIVAASEGPTITNIDKQIPTCDVADGRLTVSVAGLGNHYYSIDGRTYQQDSSFFGLRGGNFVVTVKDDSNCTAEKRINLGEPCNQMFYLPNSFTPNNDGINDGWAIFFPFANLNIVEFTIYNRWGEVVFHSKPGSVQSGKILWDGSYRAIVVNGLYTFQLQVQFASDKSHIYLGTVTVLK